MKQIHKRRVIVFIMLLPAGIMISYISSLVPSIVERTYANFLYKFIAQGLSSITGILPFSMAEIVIIAFVLITIVYLLLTIICCIKHPQYRKNLMIRYTLNLLAAGGLIYFSFMVLWGLNYHRLPFAKIAHIDVQEASVNELAALCETITERANHLRNFTLEDANGIMHLSNGKEDAFKRASKGYAAISKKYPELAGNFGRPKPVMLSALMSYTGIWGVYFPFTAEANVNISIPDSMIPNTMCHEMAHQRGFSREDEANFISYMVCSSHPDVDFQYSGMLLALIHSMNALYSHDPEEYKKIRQNYSAGVNRDMSGISAFNQKHEGTIEKVSDRINNAYLKANMQKEGVYSYGRMVDLLIGQFRQEKPNEM